MTTPDTSIQSTDGNLNSRLRSFISWGQLDRGWKATILGLVLVLTQLLPDFIAIILN